ncbi:MAG: alanine racemase [Candidatus Sungbacteria bacterium]|nr:alanine racemase [Candidatus Sungbacteria bacterium]
MTNVRTWIEIDRRALSNNVGEFLRVIPKHTQFMAVVKSNAYGHGLILVSKVLSSKFSMLGATRLWFGVDSIVEGLRLRHEGIKNPILVLGSTLPARLAEAREQAITITVSNFETLRAISRLKEPPAHTGRGSPQIHSGRPDFHIKIDTGMHRQGFLAKDIPQLIKILKRSRLNPAGIYTHFAAAKDIAYPTYTKIQLAEFKKAVAAFYRAGFKNIVRHAAASGGTLLFPETHLDMVRIGMGMYGYWPSMEARLSLYSHDYRGLASIVLKPVLTWKTVVSEIKEISAGSAVGYDLTERVSRKTKIAVLPIGYWHGFDRGLSSIGEVLIRGKRAKVLGRVSMDMIVVDITDIKGKSKFQNPNSKIKVGDEVVLIGRQGKETIWADEMALKLGTTQYEVLTRINPLIRRIAV